MFITCIILFIYIYIYIKLILKSFQKKREESSSCYALLWSCFFYHVMFCFGHAFILCCTLPCFSWQNLHQRQKFSALQLIPMFWRQKEKFTIHLSLFTVTVYPLLFMTLFTSNFSLFKRGCPLYLKQVLVKLWVQVFFPRKSYH